MTDKEQIMIDGVNITGCAWCDFEPDAEPYCRINDGEDLGCEDNPNCYFKQLARSTQRIKDLEERIINHSNEIEEYCSRLADKNKKCEKYEQALTVIKEIAEQFCNACQEFEPEKKGSNCMYCNYGKILDIIDKVRGGNNTPL